MGPIKQPLRLDGQTEPMSVVPFKRRAPRKLPRFALVVIVTVVAAFGLTYWWPAITSNSPIINLPSLDPSEGYGSTGSSASPPDLDVGGAVVQPEDRFPCRVSSITDGDTLRCTDGTRIRLHAVAAREMDETCSAGHPCPSASGASAKAELQRLAGGKSLSCSRTGRSFDRVTAICWTPENLEVNCAMIRSGKAVVWDRFAREEPICRT
jgi:endonuclease YncB( thermonuclease family)